MPLNALCMFACSSCGRLGWVDLFDLRPPWAEDLDLLRTGSKSEAEVCAVVGCASADLQNGSRVCAFFNMHRISSWSKMQSLQSAHSGTLKQQIASCEFEIHILLGTSRDHWGRAKDTLLLQELSYPRWLGDLNATCQRGKGMATLPLRKWPRWPDFSNFINTCLHLSTIICVT